MSHKVFITVLISIFLFGCSNSKQLNVAIQSIEQKNISPVYIGSKEILIPNPVGFSKVDIQNKKASQLFGKHLLPNPEEKELAVFESINDSNKFIRLVTFKGFFDKKVIERIVG